MKLKIVLCSIALLAGCAMHANTLVEAKQPKAEIIIPADAHRVEKFAANELQTWLEKITGAQLPISERNASNPELPVKIYLGKSFAGEFAKDLQELGTTDGYAVRTRNNNIYIFGNIPKGTLNGVYGFLDRNTDLIWARPQEFGIIYTQMDALAVKQGDWLDKPRSLERGWQICYTPYDAQTELWCARVMTNRNPTHVNRVDSYERSLNTGMLINPFRGHNLHRFMPKKYFAEHPEYFCLVDGKRREDVGKNQVCFSNLEGAGVFASEIIEQVKTSKYQVDQIFIGIQDNWRLCECEDCRRDINLPDGGICTAKDENFRSTQYFSYLNRVAEVVKKEFPDKRLSTFGYFFTVMPPAVKVDDYIDILFCPAVKNDKYSILEPANKKWKDRVDQWCKMSSNFGWREYYGCGSNYPRPLAEKAAEDLRYLEQLGSRIYYAEYLPDSIVGANQRRCDYAWDVSAMEFWVLSKLYWNSHQDVEKLRDEYLNRAYHQAAPGMKKFYGILRKSWYDDPSPSTLSDNHYKSAVHYIVQKGLEEPCRSALEEAAKLADTPNILELVKRTRERFEDWIKNAPLYSSPELSVPLAINAAQATTPQSEIWTQATVLDGFKVMGKPKIDSAYATTVKLMHDKTALYLLFECRDDNARNLYTRRNVDGREVCPDGDHIEFFLDVNKKGTLYNHFAVNFQGMKYDGSGYDGSWNSTWTVTAKAENDGYWIIARVPFKDIGYDPAGEAPLKAMFFRTFHHDQKDGKRENSSWVGGMVHQPSGFGTLVIEK